MPSSYSSNLLLELMADGENEGLWGDITNTNLEILGRAVSGVTTVTLSGTTHTLTVSQGALSEGHYSVLELGGSPTGTVTVTIDPNTVARIYVVKNSSGEDAIFTQGSGDNVTVSNGETKILYSDGAGASAAVTLVTNSFTDAEQSKLSNIEAGADVTDTANVTAAGALMDSELTSEASVKALDQGVATTDSPDFAGLTVNGTSNATNLTRGGSQVYSRDNILGTVSESSGTPTGAIIERGSNSNGEFVKYADGTQICTARVALTYINNPTFINKSFTYPAAFSTVPSITISIDVDAVPSGFSNVDKQNMAAIGARTPSSTSCTLFAFQSTSTDGKGSFFFVNLTGRWY